MTATEEDELKELGLDPIRPVTLSDVVEAAKRRVPGQTKTFPDR
jgi:hypothetical protein